MIQRSDPKIWAGAVIFLLAGVLQFVQKPDWPTAFILIALVAAVSVLVIWVVSRQREMTEAHKRCEDELKANRHALLRLYAWAVNNSGGRRKSAPPSLEILFPGEDAEQLRRQA